MMVMEHQQVAYCLSMFCFAVGVRVGLSGADALRIPIEKLLQRFMVIVHDEVRS